METEDSMVRPHPTDTQIKDEVAAGEYLSLSGPGLATRQSGPISIVSIAPQGAVDDSRRTVVYDSSNTDLIIVRVDNTSVSGASDVFSVCERSLTQMEERQEETEEAAQALFFSFFVPW